MCYITVSNAKTELDGSLLGSQCFNSTSANIPAVITVLEFLALAVKLFFLL